MKNIVKIFSLLLLLIFLSSKVYGFNIEEEYILKVKQDLLVLMLAYPEQIVDIEKDSNDLIYIVMKDGKKILYDDRKEKTYDEKFVNADLQDTLAEPYPLDMISEVMPDNIDPGRIRDYKLLGAMYGENQNEIEKNLNYVYAYYGTVMFNKVNRVSDELKIALEDIAKSAQNNYKIGSYVSPLSGGYNFRHIQDTGLLSPHSYGIAIDLNRNDSDYWKWVSKDKGSKRIAAYPSEIVKCFEEHGFIWGGKWAHFDILHFEYRPEIVLKAKIFGENFDKDNGEWYGDLEMSESTERIIKLIDEKIK